MLNYIKKFYHSDGIYYIIPLNFVIPVFFIIPFELYYNAQIYWDWKKMIPINLSFVGLVLYAILLFIIFVVFKLGRRKSAIILSYLISFTGLVILFSDIFAPLSSTLATGEKLVSSEPIHLTIIEILILCFCLAVALKLKVKKTASISFFISLFLCILSLFYFVLVLASSKPKVEVAGAVDANQDIKGNVYHFLLDEMQIGVAEIYLKEYDNHQKFRGFTFFKNNLSNYIYTHVSFPSYMTGSLYKKGSFENWYQNYHKNTGLFRALHEKGYRVRVYGYLDSWNNPYIDKFWSLNDIYEKSTKIKHREYQDFIQILFARTMPNYLSNESLSFGKKIGKKFFNSFINRHSEFNRTIPVSYEEGKEPFSSVQAFNHLLQDEKNRPENGQYTYLHSVLPHPPFVYDKDGNYSLNYNRNNLDAYFEHVQFAFRMIEDFMDELRKLNRYDDATIIIHSDTGRGEYGFYKKSDSGLFGTLKKDQNFKGGKRITQFFNNEDNLPVQLTHSFKDHRLGRLRSILMIKPPGEKAKLKYSNKLTQLIDIYPSLLDILSLKPQDDEVIDGLSVYQETPPNGRESYWYWFPQTDVDPIIYELSVTNPSDIENSKIKFNRIVEDKEITPFPKTGIKINIGSNSEEPLKFSGFGTRGKLGKLYYRWIVDKEATIVFKNTRLNEDLELLFELSIRPFVINENQPAFISTSLSKKMIILKKGMHSYKVKLKFQKDRDPEIKLTFMKAESPESLGIGKDTRKLAALLDYIALEIIKE